MAHKIIQNNAIATNEWVRVTEDIDSGIPDGKVILSLKIWQKHFPALNTRNPKPGLWLNSDENISDFPGDIKALPVIAIYFPTFTDGRGFSIGNITRVHFNYPGELRACGHFIRDQLFYLKRCGFNAFEFENNANLEEAAKSLQDFSDSYQISADQNIPLFRRRQQ